MIILKININTISCILIESSFDGASSPTKKKQEQNNNTIKIIVTPPSCILIERSFDGASFPTKNKNKNNDTIDIYKPIQIVYSSKGLSMVVLFLLKTK